jgi:flagellar protein FliO/FliZ
LPSSRSLTSVATAAVTSLLLVFLLPGAAWAQASKDDPYGERTPLNLPADEATHAQVGSGGGSLARTFVGLAVVVAVIYGLYWVLRQMKAAREDRGFGFGLSAEASVPLGQGRSVHLIRAGRELVLVGSAEQGVVPIRTYTEDEARELGLLPDPELDSGAVASAPAGRAAGALQAFVDWLRERTLR